MAGRAFKFGPSKQKEVLAMSAEDLYELKVASIRIMKKRGNNINRVIPRIFHQGKDSVLRSYINEEKFLDPKSGFDEFKKIYGKIVRRMKTSLICCLSGFYLSEGKKVYVHFVSNLEKQCVGVQEADLVISSFVYEGVKEAIMITPRVKLTSVTNNRFRSFSHYRTTVFFYEELLLSSPDHVLTSSHRLLSDTEKEKLLQELGTTPDNLPKIYQGDPLVKYYDWQPDNVIEFKHYPGISRSINVESTFYRYIIPGRPFGLENKKDIGKYIFSR